MSLVAGGLVDDTENGELHGTGVACDPQHIGLQAFTNFVGLRSQGRRCHLVWSLVAQACSALEVASCLNDLDHWLLGFEVSQQGLGLWMSKVSV